MKQQCKKGLALLMLTAVLFLMFFPGEGLAAQRYEVLLIGDKDDYVLALQQKLKDLGFFSAKTTGYYGTVTQQAVMDYQSQKGLDVDGKAGPVTLASIMGNDFVLPPDRLTVKNDNTADYLRPGDRGPGVSDLQQRLKELEYYDYPNITGYFGPVTQKAVLRFQSNNGLKTDGIVGPDTLGVLNNDGAKFSCVCPGDRGRIVTELQERLKALGYFSGRATGYFGTVTTESVKEFQAQAGLSVDAKVGPDTRNVLFAENAPQWDGTNRMAEETTPDQTSDTEKMIAFATEQLGKPYVYATEGPASFDCSGFVYYVLKYMGVSTARYSADGFSKVERWVKVSDRNALAPGDLLFFVSGSRTNHTGIYIGDNQFIHASSSGKCVRISSLKDYYEDNFSFARRVF